jgi:hypothetical protein
MSSHHIVRENQEPALLILDTSSVSIDTIGELLEWSPTVIVHSKCVMNVIKRGIKVDIVIAPSEVIENIRDLLLDQAPIKIVSYGENEDPIPTIFYLLNALKSTAVNIVSNEENILKQIESVAGIDCEILIGSKRWSWIRNNHIEKWYSGGTKLYVRDFNESPAENDFVVRNDGIISIRKGHSFWIGEELSL